VSHYLLSMVQPDGPVPPPEVLEPIMRDTEAVDQAMKDAGVWVYSARLHDASTATVLRSKDGQVLITDGPYVEAREHVGGFTVVDVPDLDAALAWAARLGESTTLPIEVRPFRS
jgi:hypothetical protein